MTRTLRHEIAGFAVGLAVSLPVVIAFWVTDELAVKLLAAAVLVWMWLVSDSFVKAFENIAALWATAPREEDDR